MRLELGRVFPDQDLDSFKQGATLIGLLEPLAAPEVMKDLAGRNLTVFAMELMPRTTRAQSMDALSSMATIAGYKAVLAAADALPKMFPMFMTAAGTITPARVFVLGAGVAGLQAIATARRLGAVVEAFDIRPAVKEEVESLGAKFVQLELEAGDAQDSGGYATAQSEDFYRRQQELMAQRIQSADVVITTAAVPGKKSPVLISEEVVAGMRPGAVVVDLAAEKGGNCAVTQPGKKIVHKGVIVMGPLNIPAEVPVHARIFLSLLLSISLSAPAFAQSCASEEARQLDFWLGEWDLRWGENGSGVNVITRELDEVARVELGVEMNKRFLQYL